MRAGVRHAGHRDGQSMTRTGRLVEMKVRIQNTASVRSLFTLNGSTGTAWRLTGRWPRAVELTGKSRGTGCEANCVAA